LLFASALQDEEDNQRDNEQKSDLCARTAKCRRKKAPAGAGTILIGTAMAAVFSIPSIHGYLFKKLK